MDGGGLVVGEIHGNLGEAAGVEHDAHGLKVGEAAGAGADLAGDGLGDFEVGSFEVDVVGDEEFTGADDGGAGGGVELAGAEVGSAQG